MLIPVPWNRLLQSKGAFRMAKMRTNDGTFNVRGLQRQAGTAKYEFAYETEGVGANGAARAKVPTGTGAKAQRTIGRLRNPQGR